MEIKVPPKVTDRAFLRILEIGQSKCLRVAVEGGGCSGFQYDIKLEENESENNDHLTTTYEAPQEAFHYAIIHLCLFSVIFLFAVYSP